MPMDKFVAILLVTCWLLSGLFSMVMAIRDNTRPPWWVMIVCTLGGPVSLFIIVFARALGDSDDKE